MASEDAAEAASPDARDPREQPLPGSERAGPLAVTRGRKDDGRGLLLFWRVEQREQGASAP